MAQELPDMIAESLADVLRGGWARYLELEDGTQCRTTWHQEGDLSWLHVENAETGHGANFTVTVSAVPLLVQEIEQEDEKHPDGTGEELAERGPEESGTWSMVAAGDLAQGGDGEWYEVVKTAMGGGGNVGLIMVTLLIGGTPRVYPFQPSTEVKVRRGPDGAAVQMFGRAGLGPEVLKS
jgi:hypothetical protein